MKTQVNKYVVTYTKKIGGTGAIIVKAENEKSALANARFLCFSGSDFRNAALTDLGYEKPIKQGFTGSDR